MKQSWQWANRNKGSDGSRLTRPINHRISDAVRGHGHGHAQIDVTADARFGPDLPTLFAC